MSFTITAIVGAGIAATAATAKLGMALHGRRKRIQEQEQARAEMEKYEGQYKRLDTSNIYAGISNPYANMENTMEDLTVNQQQAQFERQMAQQSQANIMQNLRGAAGGSGIAGLAQAMAGQGQLQAQRASASIGMQESQIGMQRAREAGRLQTLERRGEQYAEQMRLQGAETARGLEWSKTGTLLGMSQQKTAAANQARAQARAQQMSAVGDIGQSGMALASAAGGAGGGGGGGGGALSTGSTSHGFTDSGEYIGEGHHEWATETYNPNLKY
tara:strand:+ start:11 stop:826 length:816 start_codon:yes stop_codon:yes gene_type:complete